MAEIANIYPQPVGYRILIRPKQAAKQSDGGIVFAQSTTETMEYLSQCGEVLAMGPTAFDFCRDEGQAPWCGVGDWVVHKQYQGVPFKIKLEDGTVETVKMLNDKEILGKVADPESVVTYVG